MLFGYGHGMGAWGWVVMVSGVVLVWVLLAVLVAVLYRLVIVDRRGVFLLMPGDDLMPADDLVSAVDLVSADEPVAEQVLAELLALGEIDEPEYRSRLAVLGSDRG